MRPFRNEATYSKQFSVMIEQKPTEVHEQKRFTPSSTESITVKIKKNNQLVLIRPIKLLIE